MARMQSILVVGGGAAGWLVACYLAKHLNATAPSGIRVELVESSGIGLLGVGEATFPSMRGTLAAIGLEEGQLFAGANATFKQGIRYDHWVRPPGSAGAARFFHPFSLPSQRAGVPELLPYWLLGGAPAGMPFAEAVTMQYRLVEQGHGPKRATDPDYQGAMNYAYHFDAARVAAVLAGHGQKLGVTRHEATVERVVLDERGAIANLVTRELGQLKADLYVDCTGLRSRLIGDALQSPFCSRTDVLFVDRAVAMQVPYPRPDTPIACCTIATAKECGWIWDIGLQQRRGVGHVYSSRHSDATRAEEVLRRHLGAAAEGLEPLHIKFETGYRPEHWRANCVGIGLAAGFVEPLESTGIALVELGTYLLTHLLPAELDDMPRAAKHFNAMMCARYERVLDFIKMHYCLTQRRDSSFWIDNTDPASIPETLRERLAAWRYRPPHRLDFVTDLEMFLPSSWQYVLYGMEFRTELEPMRGSYPRMDEARHEFAAVQRVSLHAMRDLPPHRVLVEQMRDAYLQRTGQGRPV